MAAREETKMKKKMECNWRNENGSSSGENALNQP